MSDLPERLRALADSLEGDDWQHPITAQADCWAAAERIERLQAELAEDGQDADAQWHIVCRLLDAAGIKATDWEETTPEQIERAVAEIAAMRAVVGPLNRLRAEEGHCVKINCQNPDFNGQPDESIEVCGDWTHWRSQRFTGRTLAACLAAAEAAKAAKEGER